VNRVHLTAEGRRLLKRAERAYLEGVERVMGAMGAEERLRLCRTLERLRGALKGRNAEG
jgi:DNA-binding MarR family transcriptional regulator